MFKRLIKFFRRPNFEIRPLDKPNYDLLYVDWHISTWTAIVIPEIGYDYTIELRVEQPVADSGEIEFKFLDYGVATKELARLRFGKPLRILFQNHSKNGMIVRVFGGRYTITNLSSVYHHEQTHSEITYYPEVDVTARKNPVRMMTTTVKIKRYEKEERRIEEEN